LVAAMTAVEVVVATMFVEMPPRQEKRRMGGK
jgi:hypothetical protein